MPVGSSEYVRLVADGIDVSLPTQDRLGRGAWLAFVGAPFTVGCAWIGFALFSPPEPSGLSILVTALAAGLLAMVPGLLGLGLMATAARRARKTWVRIDLGERLLHRPGKSAVVYREPTAVRVARTAGLPGGWSLLLRGEDGPQLTLLDYIPRTRGRALSRAAEALAEALDIPCEVPAAARAAPSLVPESAARWAALCYLPIDGLAQAYALWALVTSSDPALRFAAKQSLASLAVEGVVGVAMLSCCGIPLAALAEAALGRPQPVVLLFPAAFFLVARAGVRLFAMFRASQAPTWVMPWLSPLSRRWL